MRISDWSSDVCSSDLELADPFATYLGWTVPWDAPLTLIGDSADDVVAARRQLARIGIDHMAAAVGQPVELASGGTTSYRRATFEDLAAERAERGEEVVVTDVHRPAGGHGSQIQVAEPTPFHDLPRRHEAVPAGQRVGRR